MRPKLLEIEGLQSYRDLQKIDFDALSETGLFGIFGPTGSGKSTVLDAITFVLYGKVKRAERGTQGIINLHQKTARVSFTFELLKDKIRKTYRVERTYQRKKGSDNSCEPKIARLIEVTAVGEIPVCDKATEVSSSIEELLGLSHDDFTRAVVLPQNSFQEFLMLDNAKKRDMLERIFYLEEYGKQLSDKLSRKMSFLKSRIDKVGGALSVLDDASDKALAEVEKELEAAVQARNQAEKELKQLEARFNEAKEVWMLVESLEQIQKKERQHLLFQEDVNQKRIQLEKAVKADGLGEMIAKTKRLAGKLLETVKELDEACAKLPSAEADLNETRNKYDRLKQESDLERPKLVALKTRLSDALEIKTEIENLEIKIGELAESGAKLKEDIAVRNEAVLRETSEFEAAEEKIKLLKEELETLKTDPEHRNRVQECVKLESEVETTVRTVNDCNKKFESLNNAITGQEEKLRRVTDAIHKYKQALDDLDLQKQKHEASKPEDRKTAMKYREEVHKLKAASGVLKMKHSELESNQVKMLSMQGAAGQTSEKLGLKEIERQKAEGFYGQCRLAKESAVKALENDTAYMLAKNLREGDPCPVCGSKDHPSPVVHAEGTEPALLEQQAAEAERELQAAEKALKTAESNYLITFEQLKNIESQISQLSEELEGKRAEYNDAARNLPEAFRALNLDQFTLELEGMIAAADEKLRAFDEWEEKLEELKSDHLKISEQLSSYKVEENGILAELKLNRENRAQIEIELKEASIVYNDTLKKYRHFLDKLKIESAAKELKRLAENDRKINGLQKEMEQMQDLLGKKRAFIEQLKEEVRELNNKKMQGEAEFSHYITQKDEKKLRLRALAEDDENIEEKIKGIEQKLEEYVSLEKQYQERLKNLETQHNKLISQKTTLENTKNIYTDSLESEQEQLNSAVLEKGFANSDEVENSMLPKEAQKSLNEKIHAYDEAERELRTEKALVLKKLDSRTIKEEEWNQVNSDFQRTTSYRETCVSRYDVAKNTHEKIRQKHDQWVMLSKSFSELNHKHGLFEQIQKLLRAEKGKDNSFIDYIAEARLRYVAAKASETLGLMTKYKFALELDSEAGFIIRDNSNGGAHRMVTSLSGGETFLTSLSLALALSEQIQLKGQSPLEFFFLDEGFGTLDNELLDTVIDSLERLSSKERVIGLISHVPELRSRIARRLIVEPPSYQGEGSKVRIEKV
ncbi:MAG: AAA family ATPase [Bacillota bacterium]|nr:AAA family ATPase [Bacillota bacterium]